MKLRFVENQGRKIRSMKRFYASLASLALVVAGLLLFNFMGADSNAALPRDCDNNSIIYCGGITPSELASRYNANKTGDLKTIYHSYGLSDYEMTHAGTSAKMGEVHRDVAALGARLQSDGAKSFTDSWNDLLKRIDDQVAALRA